MTSEEREASPIPDKSENQTQSASTAQRLEIERLRAEVLVAQQKTEFSALLLEHRERLSDALTTHKKDVNDQINRRLVALSALGLIVAGLALWATIQPIRQSVRERLDKEFASENIQKLISDAAQTQAQKLIAETLRPAISEARAQIAKESTEVRAFADQSRSELKQELTQSQQELRTQQSSLQKSVSGLLDEYKRELSQLRVEVDYQHQLREIQGLKSKAIDGDFSSYAKLVGYQTNDDSLKAAAKAALLETKNVYVQRSRTKGISIWLVNPDGTKGKENADIPTADLISRFLFSNDNWPLRAKAAEYLGSRREPGVAEALLLSTKTDPNLWVRKEALESFARLTGFQPKDVFGFEEADQWWSENKTKYLESIKK